MRGGGGGRPRAGALLWQRAAAAQPRPSPRQGTGRRPPGGSPQPEGWGQAAVRVPPNGGGGGDGGGSCCFLFKVSIKINLGR